MRAWLVVLLLAGCGDNTYDLDGGDLIVVGQKFVEQRKCPTCHDPENAAQGPLSGRSTPLPNSMVYPPNLTPDVKTGLGGWADIQIERAMRYGVDNGYMELCPTMPRFSDMTDLEANAIVAYLRGLAPVSHQAPDSKCPPVKPPPMADLGMPMDLSKPMDLSGDGGI